MFTFFADLQRFFLFRAEATSNSRKPGEKNSTNVRKSREILTKCHQIMLKDLRNLMAFFRDVDKNIPFSSSFPLFIFPLFLFWGCDKQALSLSLRWKEANNRKAWVSSDDNLYMETPVMTSTVQPNSHYNICLHWHANFPIQQSNKMLYVCRVPCYK